MPGKDPFDGLDLVFKEEKPADTPSEAPREHAEAGPSSLYGRVGDNLTYHGQGAHFHGVWERMWSWVWKDLIQTLMAVFRSFFSRS